METETIRSEQDAQKAYEDLVKETNTPVEAKCKDTVMQGCPEGIRRVREGDKHTYRSQEDAQKAYEDFVSDCLALCLREQHMDRVVLDFGAAMGVREC